MASYQFPFRQCMHDSCRFRYPVTEPRTGPDRCPLCGASTMQVALAHGLAPALDEGRPSEPPFEALLDNIRSAYNVGSMFRTADGVGIRHMHLCGITPVPDHSGVAKTALGAENAVPWTQYRNGLDALQEMKRDGYRVWGIEYYAGAMPMHQFSFDIEGPPVLLVVGNEIAGIDPGILDHCDVVLAVPMQGSKSSLNVAVAFGAAAYYLRFASPASKLANSDLQDVSHD